MRKYKEVKKTEETLDEATCGWCGKVVNKTGHQIEGIMFSLAFGYGSDYDLQSFDFEICDDCFSKYLKDKSSSKKNLDVWKR